MKNIQCNHLKWNANEWSSVSERKNSLFMPPCHFLYDEYPHLILGISRTHNFNHFPMASTIFLLLLWDDGHWWGERQFMKVIFNQKKLKRMKNVDHDVVVAVWAWNFKFISKNFFLCTRLRGENASIVNLSRCYHRNIWINFFLWWWWLEAHFSLSISLNLRHFDGLSLTALTRNVELWWKIIIIYYWTSSPLTLSATCEKKCVLVEKFMREGHHHQNLLSLIAIASKCLISAVFCLPRKHSLLIES